MSVAPRFLAAEAPSPPVRDHERAVALEAGQYLAREDIRRSVVDDDDFGRGPRLPLDACEGVAQRAAEVAAGNDESDPAVVMARTSLAATSARTRAATAP